MIRREKYPGEFTLERTYLNAQEKFWDGDKLLTELTRKHGKIKLDPQQHRALLNVISLILFGEMAAWKTSASLTDKIADHTARLSATAQAHDEARHFRTMTLYASRNLGASPNDFIGI